MKHKRRAHGSGPCVPRLNTMTQTIRTPLEEHFYTAWEQEETLTKEEIAVAQLRKAIEHFMVHDYIPAITLAGAAAELLGRQAQAVHGEQAADRYRKQRINEWASLGEEIPFTVNDVFRDLHWVRNDLKHNKTGTNDPLTRQFGRAAMKLIDAAVLNLFLINDFTTPVDEVIAKYHKEYPSWNGAIPVREMDRPCLMFE